MIYLLPLSHLTPRKQDRVHYYSQIQERVVRKGKVRRLHLSPQAHHLVYTISSYQRKVSLTSLVKGDQVILLIPPPPSFLDLS